MDKLFAVTSGKGGVGKSTVATMLASSLAQNGENVLLIDLDEGLRCLDLMLGISETVAFDLADILNGRESEAAIYPIPLCNNLSLIPAPQKTGQINPQSFSLFLREITEKYDKVVVDFPAGIDFSLYNALPDYTVFITVCTPDPVSLRDASLVAEELYSHNKQNVRLIINRFDINFIKDGVYAGIDDMIDKTGIRLLGVVPYDISLTLAHASSRLPKKGNAKKAFVRIAERLVGKNVKLPKPNKI